MFFSLSGNAWVPDADVISELVRTTDANGDPTGWQYTTLDNSVELYDVNGKLISITNVLGITQTLSYDANERLDRIDTNVGDYLQFGYDASNRIATITDHANRVWSYRYDANDNLEYVDNPDGTSKRYHYEDASYPHALTGITDERGIRYATWAYDTQGRANMGTHAGNAERVDIVYNADGTRTVTNSLGQASTYDTTVQHGVSLIAGVSGPGCSTCGGSNTSYNYDPANNNLLSKTENGVTTVYGNYDSKGQTGYRIEASGTTEERRNDYTYDSRFFNKIMSITGPSVNPAGSKATTYTYDAFGNRLSETIDGYAPDGQGGYTRVSRSTTWQYNGPLHQLSQVDGPRTDVSDITTYRYYADDAGQGNNRARLQEIEDANGVLLRSNIQYSATGKVLSESRPNGLTLTYSYYPGNDRLQTLTESDGTGSRVTQWTYLATGEVETITTGFGSPEATTLTFGYDAARRLTRITDGLGNYLEYTLDTEGNRTFEKTFDTTATLRKQLSQTFDIYNRLDTSGQANESVDYSFAPDGTLDTQTAGGGAVTDYSYDALKRLTQVVQDQGGTEPDTANTTAVYGYDVADRLTAVTDPNSGSTSYGYDDLGNLVSQTSPDTGTSTFTYDGAGNLKSRTDAKGQLFSYSYDALNRLTALDAPGTDDDVSYVYDTCLNGQGRLCTVTVAPASNEPIVTGYTYTALGDVATHQGVTYTYDPAGRVKTVTYPSGAVVTSHYDSTGQVSQVELTVDGQTQVLADGISYHPFGPVANLTYGNGATLTQAVDQAYRFSTLAVPGVLNLAAHQYDGNGNLLQRDAGTGPPVLSTFGYDALDRLDIAGGPFGTRDYDYDPNGNRTNLVADATPTAYAYEIGSNRLDTLGSSDVLLDANGNTLNQGNWTYSYTPDNRLETAGESGSLVATYAYNGLGQRVGKQTSTGTVTGYVYGLTGELLAELDVAGTPLAEYIYLNGQPLALRQYASGSGTAVDQIVDNRDAGTTASGSWAGSTVVAGFAGSDYQHHTASTVPPGGTLVDNGGAGFSVTGTWPASTVVAGFEGADYQFHEANGLPPGALIIDDASGDTSRVGTWPTSTSTIGFEGSHYSVHGAGVGDNSFSWHLSGVSPGDYHVYAKWTAHSNRASNATYTVNHAGGVTPVTVDQRQTGGEWVLLGTFALDVASEVVLSDAANGYVIADAIRAIPVNAAPNMATWAPSLPSAGRYDVYARWTAHPNRTTLATYTVHHSGGSTDVPVDQQQNSVEWRLLGSFDLDGTSQVTLTDEADGVVIADAVYFVPEGTPYNSFRWQPGVPGAGQYEVLARWTAHPNRASNASYAIEHTGGSTTVAVDQRQSGGTWISLGIYALDADSEVTLTDQADGYVVADAIRVVGTTDAAVGGTYFIHTDHLGTPVAMSDGGAVKVWSATHDPFGQATVDEDPDGNGTAVTLNVRFPGQYYDQETGLHYNGYRYYDPLLGRYLTADPIGLTRSFDDPVLQAAIKAGSLMLPDDSDSISSINHLYGYTDQNPIMRTDPDGLIWGWVYKGGKWIWKKLNKKKKNKDNKDDDGKFQCPPERRKRCEEAFWRCIADTSVSEDLCIAAQVQCISTPLPTLFPHGEWVR